MDTDETRTSRFDALIKNPRETMKSDLSCVRPEANAGSDLGGSLWRGNRGLHQAVRRNIERFPEDFMFLLSREEIMRISQIVTSSVSGRGDLKYSKSVTAFTEYGIAMLSSVLNSPEAIQVNIQIMRTFGKLREMIASHAELARRLDEMEQNYDAQFRVVFDAIRQMMAPEGKERKPIGFRVEEGGTAYV